MKVLEFSVNINAPAVVLNGRTALEGAAEHGHIDIVQLLLNAGSKPSGQEDAQYRKAINLASKSGHHAIMRLLEAYAPDTRHPRDCFSF